MNNQSLGQKTLQELNKLRYTTQKLELTLKDLAYNIEEVNEIRLNLSKELFKQTGNTIALETHRAETEYIIEQLQEIYRYIEPLRGHLKEIDDYQYQLEQIYGRKW